VEAGDAGLDERWRVALLGIDMLLNDLGFDTATKRDLLRKVRTSFAREFGADARLKKQIGDRFRKERQELEALLDPQRNAESPLALAVEILERRSVALRPAIAALKASEAAGRLSRPLQELAVSFVHMHVNRLLRSAQRAQELVIYEFLARLYDSQLARRSG
jgi:thiopeptide-type bacteriocin biosynthesis protein